MLRPLSEREARVHLIADDVASRGAKNKRFVFSGSFPTDFPFQSHRFIAGNLPVEAFISTDRVIFPEDKSIRSLIVMPRILTGYLRCLIVEPHPFLPEISQNE